MRNGSSAFLILLTFSFYGFGQESNIAYQSKNAIFFEAGGNAVFYSLNYDRVLFRSGNTAFTLRFGISLPDGIEKGYLFIPTEINILLGTTPHYFETGIGYTVSTYKSDKNFWDIYHDSYVLRLGYRFQRDSQGLFFRTGFTMLFMQKASSDIIPWAGIAAGYSF